MEETAVVIVGAGPSGLCLAAALAFHKIKSIILEKNNEICEDPRSVSINGDSQRIIQVLGIGREDLAKLGQIMKRVNFHQHAFTSKPFLSIDFNHDWLEQVLPPGTVLMQPRLEKCLRDLIQASPYAELRLECTVISICEVEGGVQATYERKDGTTAQVRGKFLVGADGKRGYVRKGYLEAKGIEQRVGLHKYQATWIAANLRIHMPTPTSHRTFPLWELGYQPEELWDLFWPPGFHFCNHETAPVATGRFGPEEEKFWRLEWELPSAEVPDDLIKELERHLDRHLTLSPAQLKRNGNIIKESVRFPQDCIEVLRCAPATFNQRVVNKWFHNNIILIGDAAHVFPPFAGQGIANGIRDAFGLAWRLALLCDPDLSDGHPLPTAKTLDCWARERRRGVDDSSTETKRNGDLLLNKSPSVATLISYGSWLLNMAPPVRDAIIRRSLRDEAGFSGVEDAFFLPEDRGGRKIAQVYVQTVDGSIHTSDRFFCKPRVVLSILLLQPPTEEEAQEIRRILESERLPRYLVSDDVVEFCQDNAATRSSALGATKLALADPKIIAKAGLVVLPSYDPASFRRRFLATTRCVLMRSDFIIFSEAQTPSQLEEQLQKASDLLLNQ